MNREEALIDFHDNFENSLLEICRGKFQVNLESNEEKLREALINGIKGLNEKVIKAQEKDKEYKITVLQFELLRINLLNDSYKILAHGYNHLWYLDKNSIYEEIDLKFLFEPFIELKEQLNKAKKPYLGKINQYDIQKIIFELAVQCFNSMSETVRAFFWNFDEEQWAFEGTFSEFYTIKWSEYQGSSETIFAMDITEKTTEQLIELKKEPEEKLPFVYSVWCNSSFIDGDLTKQNMLFINFKGSKLSDMNFSESTIVTSQFKDTEIKYCVFKEANLTAASFERAEIKHSKFDNAQLIGADFRKSSLRDTTFKNADLKRADFTDASFENVSFEGADVEDAIFNAQDVPFLHLTPEQLQTIYIIEGGEE
ncbi:MAG: pentapeptide repeat-containing protein [Clostridiaceae bacterium]